MFYMGIDPGQSGGIAILRAVGNRQWSDGRDCRLYPMPTTEADVWDVFLKNCHTKMAVIERVHSMPGQGVASTFKFGMGYGGLRMALVASSIPFDEVTPRTWQKAVGTSPKKSTESKTRFKNRIKQKAQQLFPKENVTLKTCDALLIALYCRRTYG